MIHNENIKEDNKQVYIADITKCKQIIEKVMAFLRIFMCDTLAKRIMSMVLISLGLSTALVTELTGYCDRSVRELKKKLNSEDNNIDSLFVVGGGGRKSKVKDVESSIIEEISNNNYHDRQQIADMINEKFGIKVSVWAVGRLLKKK